MKYLQKIYRISIIIFTICIGIGHAIVAQNTENTNTVEIKPAEIFQQMLKNHPIVKQAKLLSEFGKQEIRLARGVFDPKFTSNLEAKNFNDKLYYQFWETQLKIPTWFGVDIKAEYDRNKGYYLNDIDKTPAQGLEAIGISVPLAQGLFMDYRRATVREAQFAKEIFEADRIKIINKTLLQAAKDYWQWYESYNQYQLAKKGYDLAKIRFDGIVQRALQGDAAAIDSVEAKITLQDRQIALQKSEIENKNAKLILSNHLWGDAGEPLEIADNQIPSTSIQNENALSSEELILFANENHPELIKLSYKLKQLEIQRKLAREMLKPVINVNYNLLQLDGRLDNTLPSFFDNNYKWGFNVAFPLLFRKERGKLQQTKIKQQQTTYERLQVNREIVNEIKANYNELKNIESLLQQVAAMINNYKILVTAETDKFNNGESSLFLVNSRETKLLESEAKLIELQYKYAKIRATLLWAAGKTIED
jgi:outer membrane protein TolC